MEWKTKTLNSDTGNNYYEKILQDKFTFAGGINKIYRVVVIENGCKKTVYDFATEEEATICYGLLFDYNSQNEDYMLKKEVFLTIYYGESC